MTDLFQKFLLEGVAAGNFAGRRRLRYIVRRPGLKGAQADLGILFRQGRRHDDFDVGFDLQKLRERRQAVHHRHFDVQNDDVDGMRFQAVDGHLAVADRRRDAQTRLALDHARDQAADHGGIVDQHDADFVTRHP